MDSRVLILFNLLFNSSLSGIAYEALSAINSTKSRDLDNESSLREDPEYRYEDEEAIRQLNIVSRYVTNHLQLEIDLATRSRSIVESLNETLPEEYKLTEIKTMNTPEDSEGPTQNEDLISDVRLDSMQSFLHNWKILENAVREIIENEESPDQSPDDGSAPGL